MIHPAFGIAPIAFILILLGVLYERRRHEALTVELEALRDDTVRYEEALESIASRPCPLWRCGKREHRKCVSAFARSTLTDQWLEEEPQMTWEQDGVRIVEPKVRAEA